MRRRLARVRFAGGLRRTHLAAAGLALATVLLLRIAAEWRADEVLVVMGIFLAWGIALAVFALLGLPQVRAAMLLLDQKGGWKDCFSSAWEFLQAPAPTAAQELHLERAGKQLPEALAALPAVLPFPSLRLAWLAPLVALLFAVTPWFRTAPDSRDLELTGEMKNAAALQAEELQRTAERIETLSSLSEEEKAALEALGQQVEAVAEELADPEGLTTGEMLESLEGRAREAEKLAEKLALYSDGWASEAMIEAMTQQPDTADLGLLIRDKAAADAAGETLRLHDLLDDEGITREANERMTRALAAIMQAATEDDRTKPVGERFGNASLKMKDAQPKTAAREFEELAKFFREMAERKETAAKLDRLADTLREAGSEISGSELRKMESLADAGESGSPASDGLRALDADMPGMTPEGLDLPGIHAGTGEEPPMTLAAAPQTEPGDTNEGQKIPVPGAAGEGGEGEGEKSPSGEKGAQAFSAPIPGETATDGKSGSALGQSDQSQQGEGEGGMLSAPVPGMAAAEAAAPGAGLSPGEGTSSQSGKGGDQAGSGTVAMTEEATSADLQATSDSKVTAQAGSEGESIRKSVEGEVRTERATRNRQDIIADFIAVEEQALDDQPLPLSRRQHVLRYFSALREQFEKDGDE